MSAPSFATLHNGTAIARAHLPGMTFGELRSGVIDAVADDDARVVALFGLPAIGGQVEIVAVLADDRHGLLKAASAVVEGDAYPALTPECHQVHLFEREIAEQWGLRPEGHPWLKPVRFVPSRRPGHDAWGRNEASSPRVGVMDFYRVDGDEVHEVAVGPVHAGIIEPGHFRFQCHGEEVLHLEISLGYQHRGVERALVSGPDKRTIHYVETLAGDTTIGHTLAYAQAMEALGGITVPARALALRGLALELERLANHVGGLGGLATDVGFLPTSAYCGRLRGDFLNLTALLCGSRFGRGLVRPGGVRFDLDRDLATQALTRLEAAARDVASAVELLWSTPSVMARLEETGRLDPAVARDLGLVGVAARACGIERDVRHDLPAGIFQFTAVPISTWHSGDVFARAYVRWLEVQRSLTFVRDQLVALASGPTIASCPSPGPDLLAVSLVEGWRGEIAHVALTDSAGRFAAYKVVDPSFHNWMGLALAMRSEPISDFPLCNKSFDLSYCGHDL